MDNNFDIFEQDIKEKPINWREIFEKILFNWKWFVVSAVIAVVVGAVYSRLQNDIYELKSSVLIMDQTRSGQMNEMTVLKQLDAAGMAGTRSSSMINNEEQVMKSTALMKRVVNRLELYTTYTHRKFLKTEELYTDAPVYVSMDSASVNNLKGTLEFKITPETNQLLVEGSYNTGKINKFSQLIHKLPATINTPAGRVTIQHRSALNAVRTNTDSLTNVQPKANLDPVSKAEEDEITEPINVSITNPVIVAKSLSGGSLSTEVGKMIDIINLTFHSSNIQKGQDVLNTLAAIYNQDASEQNNLSAINTAKFIDTRLKLLTKELSDVEQDIENYKQVNNLTDIKEDAQLFITKNSANDQRQIEVEMQQHLSKYVEEFIKNPANRLSPIPNLGLTDLGLAAMIMKYNELLMTRERIAAGSSDENPGLKSIDQEVVSARKAILTGISNNRNGLQISKNDLNTQNTEMKSKIRGIPRQEREFIEIKRQQQVKESLFLFLLHKREEASLNMAITVPKSRVLVTPDDASFVGPHRSLIVLIFLLLGVLIPGLVIYIMELVNTSIRNRNDVEKLTDITVLSELGHDEGDSIFINYLPNASSNSELFRLLRTKLQFTLDHSTEKTIVVTSTMPGEGKTFVSINLAIMLSLADKKVLLMGMDLRNPQLAKYFNIKEKDGISAYLSGQEVNYKSLIHVSSEFPDLSIFPAGVIPPNPTELIMKDRFDTLMNELKLQYDFIIIDSAPVGAVSDTFLIDRTSDLTLYICRAGYTDKRNIEFVNRIKTEKSLKRIYFLVNDVDLEMNKYSYHRKYGYGYGYKYGYGYGQNNKKKK